MRVLLLASMFTLVACAHHRDATTVCPEYRGLRCITFAECSYDRARGCEVCRCASLEAPRPASDRGTLPPAYDTPR